MKKETIDITPTWESILPLLNQWIDNGKPSQKEYVKEELKKLALLADKINKENKQK